MESKNIGSTFDSWLKKEGIHQQVSAEALQHVPTRRNFNGILSVARQLLDLHPADLGELLEMLARGFPAASREQFLSRSGFPIAEAARCLRLSTAQARRQDSSGRAAASGSARRYPHHHAVRGGADGQSAVGQQPGRSADSGKEIGAVRVLKPERAPLGRPRWVETGLKSGWPEAQMVAGAGFVHRTPFRISIVPRNRYCRSAMG